jgi:hypothetical protein
MRRLDHFILRLVWIIGIEFHSNKVTYLEKFISLAY